MTADWIIQPNCNISCFRCTKLKSHTGAQSQLLLHFLKVKYLKNSLDQINNSVYYWIEEQFWIACAIGILVEAVRVSEENIEVDLTYVLSRMRYRVGGRHLPNYGTPSITVHFVADLITGMTWAWYMFIVCWPKGSGRWHRPVLSCLYCITQTFCISLLVSNI